MTNDEVDVVVRPWLARVLAVFQKIGRMSEHVSEANQVRPTTDELLALSITDHIDLPDRWHEVSEAVLSGNGNRILECVDCINEVRGRWRRAMRYGYVDFDILRDDQDTFNNCIDGMRRLDIKPDDQWLDDVIKSNSGDIDRGDAELSVSHPFQILSVGNAAIAKAQKAVLDTLAIPNQVLRQKGPQREKNADCRVDSQFPKPDDSLTNVAIEHLQKTFHKLPHAGTVKASQVIADAVKGGIQRNAVEWALMRMQEYGWIKLSIPVWGGVIGTKHGEPTFPAPVQEQKRWYFGSQEYNLRLTEYFYNPTYCITCSKLIGDYDYDRSECHDCRSQLGKLLDLKVAIHASGDSPDRIPEWKMIRALLRDAFGPDRTIEELWELMEDRLRVNGWDEERWLRHKYGDFIELLKSGLLNGRSNPAMSDFKTDPLADLAIDHARSREEAAEKEWRNQSMLDRLEVAWDNIYVPFPLIGRPVDYAKWTRNLLAFACAAKEAGHSELFLKALPTRDDERKALSLIQAAIIGGENAVQLRLIELERPSADKDWKVVFNDNSLFWSTVRPKHAGENDTQGVSESSTEQLTNPLADTSSSTRMDSKPKRPDEVDDKLPKKLRKDSPSRVKAKAAYNYAIERIPNAQHMTISELHAAILDDDEVAAMVPGRADVFGTYLRQAGIKKYKLNS